MKIYLSGYRNHWVSPYTILEKFFCWMKDYDAYKTEPPKWLETLCEWNKKFLDTVHPRIEYVKIDKWDTWSMDMTVGKIMLPMFKQLKATKHGAPATRDEDVPDYLKSMNAPRVADEWDIDDFHFARWDYILDEIIWAFENINHDDWEEQYRSGISDIQWKELEDGMSEMIKGPNDTRVYDWNGYRKHSERIDNGFRLMGVYFRNMWD